MENTYKIRPAGRHILTIGRDLIQDKYAAVIELVKNAYDADATEVTIDFEYSNKHQSKIIIWDDGHGMSKDTVVNKWLVPSTDDKLRRKKSLSGKRIMQGRKGVGRYAASLLGDSMLMESITPSGEKTTVFLEWQNFIDAEYLDDVEILVENYYSKAKQGTYLEINIPENDEYQWSKEEEDQLNKELKKLIPPLQIDNKDIFKIYFSTNYQKEEKKEEIEPYPLSDIYDYRIKGKINDDGKGIFEFSNQRAKNTIVESVIVSIPTNLNNFGKASIDIRVYDRESDALDGLIKRGLKDDSGNYLGKNEVKRMLNDSNGIGVYRNGFRIRPLGDANYDWLELNRQRIQNPSLRVGSNQVIGFVEVESEEKSGLIEKSARDGLRENLQYHSLKKVTQIILTELETRRYEYRKKTGLSRGTVKIENELEKLFSNENVKNKVQKKLTDKGVDTETTQQVIEYLAEDQKKKNLIVEDIQKAVAIYQGQATLGKIMNIVLHEGRKPLNFFKNGIGDVVYWVKKFEKTGNQNDLFQTLPVLVDVKTNSEILVELFKKIDPLAMGNRAKRKEENINDLINGAYKIFSKELSKNNIKFIFNPLTLCKLKCWKQDIYSIFTNLIENSLYWFINKDISIREIEIRVKSENEQLLYVDYRDTGPGIDPSHIEKNLIFEPEFSTKPEGTGLGLAIAGEAATRNGLKLKALESEDGAYFRLEKEEID